MTGFPDANDMPNQPNISPTRPPQLNVCKCRCGCLCSGESEGDGGQGDRDGASVCSLETLVPSDHSDVDADFFAPPSTDGPEEQHTHLEALESNPHLDLEPLQQTRDINAFLARFSNIPNGHTPEAFSQLSFEQYMTTYEEQMSHFHGPPPPYEEYIHNYNDDNDSPNSMRNECGSDEHHSVVSSELGSVHCISPGPGLGAWTEEGGLREYHFSGNPLRLTPQRRNCRGLVARHLVVRDV